MTKTQQIERRFIHYDLFERNLKEEPQIKVTMWGTDRLMIEHLELVFIDGKLKEVIFKEETGLRKE